VDFSSVDFGRIFSAVFDLDFGWFCPGLQFTVKRPACLCFWPLGALFERFGNFGTQLAVCSMPALRKCDLVPLVANAILDVLLSIIFGAILDPFFEARWRDDLPVYRCFLDLGCWLGPLFRPVLDPVLDRVFPHLEIRLCFLPCKNSLDVCLPIANKSVHPLRVRSVAK
jgi:hypothetical protein